jgi:hypothetical protein
VEPYNYEAHWSEEIAWIPCVIQLPLAAPTGEVEGMAYLNTADIAL